jgi:hypothetical protein
VLQLRSGGCQRDGDGGVVQGTEACADGLVDHKHVGDGIPRVRVLEQCLLVLVYTVPALIITRLPRAAREAHARSQLPEQAETARAARPALQPKNQRILARQASRFHEPEEQLRGGIVCACRQVSRKLCFGQLLKAGQVSDVVHCCC